MIKFKGLIFQFSWFFLFKLLVFFKGDIHADYFKLR